MDDTLKLRQLEFYARQGWPLVPIHFLTEKGTRCSCGRADCSSPGKHPMTKNGLKDATTDAEQIAAWHIRWPDAGWGMRTGSKESGGAGVDVLDLDRKTGGLEAWDMLREEHPGPIETVTVRTRNDGRHLWFMHPADLDLRNTAGKIVAGIDTRGSEGYVLVPPSEGYAFELAPGSVAIEEWPTWLLERLDGRARTKGTAPRPVEPVAQRVGEVVDLGTRHRTLVEVAGSLRRSGLGEAEIVAALTALRDQRFATGDHAVSDEEIRQVVAFIEEKPPAYNLTDLGNAERLRERHGTDLLYCHGWGKWLCWDGRRWQPDADAEVNRRATETIRNLYTLAANTADADERTRLAKHALASENRGRIAAMLDLAPALMPIRAELLDRHPMLLNAANGTLDLRTGKLQPHDRNHLMTKCIDVVFDMAAECPEWEKFITMVTGGDGELNLFLQLACGYSLTGLVDEHALFMLLGEGLNGKSTFTTALQHILGGYARRIDMEALMQTWGGHGNSATPYLAALQGVRFALATETPEGRRLNEAAIKDLTGGDVITARYLHANPIEFAPTHKLWLYGNHRPRVAAMDLGFWRRMRVVPFAVTIPEDVRLPQSEIMARFDREAPGILAWMVAGCLLWQGQGLGIPGAVAGATSQYKDEMDLVRQFLDERCEQHPDYSSTKVDLFRAFRVWCEETGEEAARHRGKRWLTTRLLEKGFIQTDHQDPILRGVQLKQHALSPVVGAETRLTD